MGHDLCLGWPRAGASGSLCGVAQSRSRRESGCRAAPDVGTDTVTGSELQVGLFLCSRHQAEPLHSLVLGSVW